jgi:hypothetical protein
MLHIVTVPVIRQWLLSRLMRPLWVAASFATISACFYRAWLRRKAQSRLLHARPAAAKAKMGDAADPHPPRARPPPATFCISSSTHRQWMQAYLERAGWVSAPPAEATFCWLLAKKLLPRPSSDTVAFNCLPNILLLDDKAVLALLSRRFTRTRALRTHVVYGEWDDLRLEKLAAHWSDPACEEPRWWIVKDAHASNGFSAALFDRAARPLCKQDVSGGYCYVVQEYVDRPMLIGGRKFEMRQYVLLLADGSAYTYDGALLRLASVAYELHSSDRRAHITNKFVQTGWEEQNDVCTVADLEIPSIDWEPYANLLECAIIPLVADLADAVLPLLVSGLRAQQPRQPRPKQKTDAGSGARAAPAPPLPLPVGSPNHFELFACDLVVSAASEVFLMEVNVNPAFGKFTAKADAQLIRPMFEDLLQLCVLGAAGAGADAAPDARAPRTGRFRCVRPPGLTAADGANSGEAASELQAHLAYMTFKKSSKKKYERKATTVAQPMFLSDTDRSAEYERASDGVLGQQQLDQAERLRAERSASAAASAAAANGVVGERR